MKLFYSKELEKVDARYLSNEDKPMVLYEDYDVHKS